LPKVSNRGSNLIRWVVGLAGAGDGANAASSARPASSRYRSAWAADISCADATVSNPWADRSSGSISARGSSTPSGSRRVFSYSMRFSRRTSVRPSVRRRSRSASARPDPTHFRNAARSAAAGLGLFLRGISPSSTRRSTTVHLAAEAGSAKSAFRAVRSSLPLVVTAS
jgi:hypothetical protein